MVRRLVAVLSLSQSCPTLLVPVRKGAKTFLLSFRKRFDSVAGEQTTLGSVPVL